MNLFSIIVTYNPNVENLISLSKTLISDNVKVIVVDNTETSYIGILEKIDGVLLIKNEDNLGIAKAQNIGIKKAIDCTADVIIFFDQDSKIEKGFIDNLTCILDKEKAIISSPIFFDEQKKFKFPSIRLNKLGMFNFFYPLKELEPYLVDAVISSGTAVTIEVFKRVGLMDETYFIDFVDTEWCLRCRNNNIPIYTMPNAVMLHTIGDKHINLFFLRLSIHTPIRTYYKVRNSFIFFNNRNVPFALGFSRIIVNLIHNFISCIISKDKNIYFKHYFQAIVDGFMGVKGKKIIK
jgi:rhamnosyltransferase